MSDDRTRLATGGEKPNSKQLTVGVDPEIFERVKRYALEHDQSLADVLRELIGLL